MQNNNEPAQLHNLALNMIRNGKVGDDLVKESGLVGTPIAVQEPGGKLHSWFVPVTIGSQITSFFQFLPDGTFMRYSTFQRHVNELAGCPTAADWLDPKLIRKRAQTLYKTDETSGEPFLTFDRSPDRLVWAVPLTKSDGKVRLVYVAGGTAYAPPPSETYG